VRGLAVVLLLVLGACSAPRRAPRPEQEIERLPDPWAERSLQGHLESEEFPRDVRVLDAHGRELRFTVGSWAQSDERETPRREVLPDYGLYANPIP